MPANSRGPRRKRVVRDALLLACPRVSPEWELAALKTLIKPQMGGRIAHRHGLQPWPRDGEAMVTQIATRVNELVGFAPAFHFPTSGDYQFAASFTPAQQHEARGLALAISKALPGVWLTCERLFLRDGQFYRRRRGFMLELSPARDVHLPAGLRAALRDVLRGGGLK